MFLIDLDQEITLFLEIAAVPKLVYMGEEAISIYVYANLDLDENMRLMKPSENRAMLVIKV